MSPRIRRLLLSIALALACAAIVTVLPGQIEAAEWQRWNLSSTRAYRYAPDSVAGVASPPVIVFFHGYGATPNGWQPILAEAAEAARAIVLAPKSQGVTWSLGVDDGIVEELLARLATERTFDRWRLSLAGHSAGGSYASWLAHARPPTLRVSGVMSASAAFLPIPALADPGNRAPVRLLYGTLDPNYTAALPLWRAQWAALGVPTIEEIVTGAGHSAGLTADMFVRGFVELAARRYVGSSATCTPDSLGACLLGGRYRVTARRLGEDGEHPLPWLSFTAARAAVFADGENTVSVRLVDACNKNQRRWVVAASTAPGSFRVDIDDTRSDAAWSRQRPANSTAALVDRSAFGCQP